MKPSPQFRTLLKGAANDEIAVPLLRTALWSPTFPEFSITVQGFEDRPFDGWFHPSTHPLWPERLLYIYMAEPERMYRPPFDPTSTLAVTAGTFFHTFVQVVLIHEGVLERQPEMCACGWNHPERAEVYLKDPEVKSRGHSDGVLYTGDGFEFKTMNPAKMYGIPKTAPDDPEILDWFRLKCPDYYAQAQEYLRMSGRQRMVVVILSLTYPFEMKEIHVPFDRPYATALRDKFARVLQAVADQRPPRCECGPQEKDCPARLDCWHDETL